MKNYAFGSRSGQLSVARQKENQDSAIIEANFGRSGDYHLFAVADGHGAYGHKVSFYVKLSFPRTVTTSKP